MSGIFSSPSIPPPPPLPEPTAPPEVTATGPGSSATLQRKILASQKLPGASTVLGGSYGGTVQKKTLLGQ